MKKTPTLFKRDPSNMSRVVNEPHPDCAWVIAGEGVATRKYDGTCCMVREGKLFKRRELKGGKQPNRMVYHILRYRIEERKENECQK